MRSSPGWSSGQPKGLALTRWLAVRRSPRGTCGRGSSIADGKRRLCPFPGKGWGVGSRRCRTASNRLSNVSNPTSSFGYDAAGNTLSDTGSAYTAIYGLDNRLATLTRAGVTTSFSYDAGGQRVRKVVGSSRPHFVYDQNGQLLGEYNSVGAALQEFVWLGNTLVAVPTNSTTKRTWWRPVRLGWSGECQMAKTVVADHLPRLHPSRKLVAMPERRQRRSLLLVVPPMSFIGV